MIFCIILDYCALHALSRGARPLNFRAPHAPPEESLPGIYPNRLDAGAPQIRGNARPAPSGVKPDREGQSRAMSEGLRLSVRECQPRLNKEGLRFADVEGAIVEGWK